MNSRYDLLIKQEMGWLAEKAAKQALV